ncbi:nitrite reductase [Sistotremastrum niveocremeum HHB9708]|uniref:Nitrite reductase [NAD(P)H] n=1 Tax=Sistotremastrum niveocremeum HHB9708 TaxID=1314777 RepID=A0A164PF92_9AGAM|nr:nitrite reductase [Sistotremastrum niveocremeum HHB9708]
MDEPQKPRKVVFVVGLGMVGIAFIEKLLNLDSSHSYTIITCGEESHLAYNRVALTEYLQHRSIEKLYLNQKDWYARQPVDRFEFFTGETVVHLDPSKKEVRTSKERVLGFDICVLATGSHSAMPPYLPPPRLQKTRGIFVYRNIADLDNILSYAEQNPGGRAVVVGGGLLGLEAAKAVYDLEEVKDVAIVNRQAYPLSRQLDNDGGDIVLRRIEAMGVQVLTHASVRDIITSPSPTDPSIDILTGLHLSGGSHDQEQIDCMLVIYAIGITPRDDLARSAGIKTEKRGGIVVDDSLMTSAKDVYAIGECASWKGETYGLIAPGIEMADILSFNLTQTNGFKPRKMNAPDLSTKLKLMGVDVASYGDFFAEKRLQTTPKKVLPPPSTSQPPPVVAPSAPEPATSKKKKHAHGPPEDGPIECLVYRDPFGGVYKKYIFSADGKYLLGGMMVGDTSDYVKMVALVKKKKQLEVSPSQFILGAGGAKGGGEDGDDLDDDTQICSCHNVAKGDIINCVNAGMDNLSDIKVKTKAGTGCGGCMPLVTSIFKSAMTASGHTLSTALCPHFPHSRADLFHITKIKKLKTFTEVMEASGTNKDAVGCEICKPAVGSILSSIWNEHVMQPVHHQNQDTNDRFMANIQRNGTFSVVPRIAGGEITPDKLIVLGQVAKKYNLYTKITGGQRIDLFGAQKQDLPDIWAELVEAGFESGHAYGKSLRTVKSCVGTTWCRYGIGDSVGLAIQLEERYKGIRSPHKIKGGVSGCVRECAEAQSKDFGLIASDKGWNIFLAGNGGATPRHATLFATDVPPSKVVRIIDRFLMYYIQTADKLMRTARWIEQFEGGIERLKKIILDDELGICADLDRDMDELVGTYADEWKTIVEQPERKKQFRQFVNTVRLSLPLLDKRAPQIEEITERGQARPADWPKAFPSVKMSVKDIATPKNQWTWKRMAKVDDLTPTDAGTTSAAVKYGDSQISIFHVPKRGFFATQQMCPHRRAFVLDHGIIGDDAKGNMYISCPLHKRNFKFDDGECLNDEEYSIITFDVREEEDGHLSLLLPEEEALDAVLGTSKWMVRQATAEALGRGSAGQIEFVGPDGRILGEEPKGCNGADTGSGCGNSKLEW